MVIETQYFSAQLIQELVTMAAEQENLVKRREVEPTLPLKALFTAFETACRGALVEALDGLPLEGDVVDVLMDTDGPFLILMTLEGQGVGIWDGSWDDILSPSTIKDVQTHLHNRLSFFADETGGGVIPEQLLASARVSVGLSAYGPAKGHKCPLCGHLYSDESIEAEKCGNCNYKIPEQILSHYNN